MRYCPLSPMKYQKLGRLGFKCLLTSFSGGFLFNRNEPVLRRIPWLPGFPIRGDSPRINAGSVWSTGSALNRGRSDKTRCALFCVSTARFAGGRFTTGEIRRDLAKSFCGMHKKRDAFSYALSAWQHCIGNHCAVAAKPYSFTRGIGFGIILFRWPLLLPGLSEIGGGTFLLPGVTAFFHEEGRPE